ncbi:MULTISPECIES: hypothetical protein [Glaesserella]|uniref:Lipoprotein n=1 Tax=Glaesserella australis TaxID=2094024 RepID=A0A328BXC8_9PAST|nr:MULTISPECIES: hypothetical protein [Glaesserella]AUI67022.1 hypothetical protein CJD39_10780 [Glaesserella sp. 15-184]RAL18886.1 hypothetical protein C5N92_05240 [Glaesserella australis]
MKRFLSFIFTTILAVSLVACTTTTTDPAVGKSDYQKYLQWLENVESTMDNKLEVEFSKAEPKNQSEEIHLFNSVIEKSFDDAVSSGKALDLRHEEVRKLRDMSVEMLNTYKQVLPAYLIPTPANIQKAEALQPKLEQLVKDGEALMEKLDAKFGTQ